MNTIDTVDLTTSDAPDGLDRALRKDGFVQLVGHRLDETVAGALWEGMDELYSLPLAVKLRYIEPDPAANRGYRQRGSEALSYSLGVDSPPDLFESFNSGHDSRAGASALMVETPWPTEAPTFVRANRAYLDAMAELSERLDMLLGSIIGIDDLADRSRSGPDTMACIRYERRDDEAAPSPGQKRMGAHSDYTTFTILRADPVPGLEILANDGWKSVVPEPGALLLNVGDLLAMWTNDAWPSTVHRVPLRGDGTDPTLRRSVAYFHYPDLDTVVAPLPRFRQPTGVDQTDTDSRHVEDTQGYSPVTVGEHLAARLVGPKQHAPSQGTSTLSNRQI